MVHVNLVSPLGILPENAKWLECNVVSLHFKYIVLEISLTKDGYQCVYVYLSYLCLLFAATKSTAHRSVHGYAYLPQGMRVCNEWKGNCV